VACCSAIPTSNTRSGYAAANAFRPLRRDRHQLVGEHLGPGRARRGQRLTGLGVDHADAVEVVGRVVLGVLVAEPLAGDAVHQHRPTEPSGPGQRVLDGLDVVPVDRPDVLQAQVLEHALRSDDVLESLLHPVQRVVQRGADDRRTAEDLLAPLEEPLVAPGGAQGGEMVRQPADGGRVGPLVVVDDDDQPTGVVGRDVVQRLPGHPAGQRPVADHGHHVPVGLATQLVGLGQPVGVGQRGRGVRVLDHVVVGLGPARVPGQAVLLPQPGEPGSAPGDDLVHVRLVAGVPQDPVVRRVEDPVQRQRELDGAEIGAEVAAGARHRGDQEVPDLLGQRGELRAVQPPQVPGSVDRVQHPATVRRP
jgi:hypothetical protein